jgi:hypothetical protein
MWTRRLFDLGLLLGFALAAVDARATPPAPATTVPDEDPLATYRGQFKRGMERYKAGALAEAIGYWDPIYRELGEQSGYRLAYDIGVAYQELGDATHAAERLLAFLTEVDVRRERGEPLAPIVEKEEADARSRIAGLMATKGRVHVEAVGAPRTARVDASEPRLAGFVAWVTPGRHTVTFGAGTPEAEAKQVQVDAGEIIRVAPMPPPAPFPSPPTASPEPSVASRAPPPSSAAPVTHRETHHPFPWPLIAVSGGVTVLAAIAAAPLYVNASSMYDRLSLMPTISASDRESFTSARTLAYSVVGGAIGLAAVTAGLAAWYFAGTSEREVMVTPALPTERGGAAVTVTGRF